MDCVDPVKRIERVTEENDNSLLAGRYQILLCRQVSEHFFGGQSRKIDLVSTRVEMQRSHLDIFEPELHDSTWILSTQLPAVRHRSDILVVRSQC